MPRAAGLFSGTGEPAPVPQPLTAVPGEAQGATLESHALTYKVNTSVSDADIVKGMFPQFDDQRKTEFLVLRTCLTTAEARHVLGISAAEYNNWRATDSAFYDWDINHFHKIRGNIAAQVLKARFMRNVFLQMAIDSELLGKRMFLPEEMSSIERDEAKEAAKRYGPTGVATMLKILGDTTDTDESDHVKIELDIKIDGDHVDQYSVRKAKARALLDWANKKEADQSAGTIEGQYTVVSGEPGS